MTDKLVIYLELLGKLIRLFIWVSALYLAKEGNYPYATFLMLALIADGMPRNGGTK